MSEPNNRYACRRSTSCTAWLWNHNPNGTSARHESEIELRWCAGAGCQAGEARGRRADDPMTPAAARPLCRTPTRREPRMGHRLRDVGRDDDPRQKKMDPRRALDATAAAYARTRQPGTGRASSAQSSSSGGRKEGRSTTQHGPICFVPNNEPGSGRRNPPAPWRPPA